MRTERLSTNDPFEIVYRLFPERRDPTDALDRATTALKNSEEVSEVRREVVTMTKFFGQPKTVEIIVFTLDRESRSNRSELWGSINQAFEDQSLKLNR